MLNLKRVIWSIVAMFCVLTLHDVVVLAQGASGTYRIDESYIGTGSNLDNDSTNYSVEAGQQSTGNTSAVQGTSTNFQVEGGATTTADPTLRCELDAASIDFGAFSTAVTSTATATFRVLNYTAYGYEVSMIGPPPGIGNYDLTNMATNAASTVGTEQFGINLVANTDPEVFGAFPVQDPDASFSYGEAATNYDTANSYRYNDGETIASAPKSSGLTQYTISFIVNVSNNTPGGTYTGQQVILCTGTY